MSSISMASAIQDDQECRDQALLDLWHPLGSTETLPRSGSWDDQLLGAPLTIEQDGDGLFTVVHRDEHGEGLPVLERYGYLWTSLGAPRPMFVLPEAEENDRRKLHAVSVDIHTSAGRAIENFLDLGHFPFVHDGVLGEEPRTEVKDYNVTSSVADQEILAFDCVFYQPRAAKGSTSGAEVDYNFRVLHPHCSTLYKSSPMHPDRMDVIALFVQALDQEHVRAHMWLCLLDDETPDWALRSFQVDILGHDKPILENQLPRRLPLDPRAETPIRADKTGVSYRRLLGQLGIRYGVIPGAM